MNIINSRINELIEQIGTAPSKLERDRNAGKLRNFIRAYGTAQRVSAVKDQHRIIKNLGLVFVDAAQLRKLNERMSALASQAGDAMYDIDVEWLNAGLQVSLAMEPREADADLEGPEFTIDDPDVDRLLNDTAMLLSGHANMDVGISWANSLETVMDRLKEVQVADVDDEIDAVEAYQTRYRIHMVLSNMFGLRTLKHFKNGYQLGELLHDRDRDSLFVELQEEFGVEFDAASRDKMLVMTSDDLLMAINAIPNKKGLGK